MHFLCTDKSRESALAFSDPQTITVNAVAKVLNRVSTGTNTSRYQLDTGDYALTVAHTYGNRMRRSVRMDVRKLSADPLISSQNVERSMSVYTVFDLPIQGWTVAQAKLETDGYFAYLQASSGAIVTKILGGES